MLVAAYGRVRRPINLCAAEVPTLSVGVFRQSSNANSGSSSLAFAFFSKVLQVLTAFSARPLDWG